MQYDMGGLWRHEVLRRMREAQMADAARRPPPPPAPDGVPVEPGDEPVGVWEEAIRSCERGLAVRPDLVGLWVGLSVAAGRLGDLEMAEGADAVARVLSPGEAEAWRDALQRDFPEIDLSEAVDDKLVRRRR